MKYTIAIYEIGLGYGGVEEGGWWFNSGTFERIVATTNDKTEARRICKRFNDWLYALINDRNRDVSSVCYSGGSYEASVYKGLPPVAYPESKPFYQ